MKRTAWFGVVAAIAALGLAGCDWDTGSDATNWSSAYNWVNFSGTYRSAAGGILVTDYTTTPSTPGSTNVVKVSNKAQGSFVAGQVGFSGSLNPNTVPGSVTIKLYRDNGDLMGSYADNGNGVLGGNSEGNVQYTPGTWNLTLNTGYITAPGVVRADYSYYVSNVGTGGGAQPGSSGKTIFAFNVEQMGQHLTITDNNGAVYKGYIREMRTASGAERGDEATRYMPVDGDTMIATFDCSGTSSAGVNVKLVGSFQGTVAGGVFTGRTITGTWIESRGKTGEIRGQTTTIPIVTTGAETETAAAQ